MLLLTYFKNTSYLLVKIALRFLSRIPKIYVDPKGIAQGSDGKTMTRVSLATREGILSDTPAKRW